MVHELAHQWFGDDVTPAPLERRVAQRGPRHLVRVGVRAGARRPGFYLEGGSFESQVRAATPAATSCAPRSGPVAAPIHGADDIAQMFSPNVYEGGALVLYALRQVVGDPTFRTIEREWPQRFGGGPASTADFIALRLAARASRPHRVPDQLALRHEHAAHAGPPRLDRRPGARTRERHRAQRGAAARSAAAPDVRAFLRWFRR